MLQKLFSQPSVCLGILVILLSIQIYEAKWLSWKPYSACSRSCGTGVQYRERTCKVPKRLSQSHISQLCPGESISYRLCNKQECPAGNRDFRAAQCEEFNAKPLDGKLYSWLPYYGHGRTCQLLCAAEEFYFYHKLRDKVTDGTPCGTDDYHICVDGVCQTFGCDGKIGSTARLDTCGKCGGDNSTCRQQPSRRIEGHFDKKNLDSGYTAVVEIPRGSSEIYVTELGENKNPLILWDSSGNSFALDTETRQNFSETPLAGTSFRFNPDNAEKTIGTIVGDGPTAEDITVYMVNTGHKNPGLRYGFHHHNPPAELQTLELTGAGPSRIDSSNKKKHPVAPEASNTDLNLVDRGGFKLASDPNSLIRLCQDEYYGCCPDGLTAAGGPDMMGCPSTGSNNAALVPNSLVDASSQSRQTTNVDVEGNRDVFNQIDPGNAAGVVHGKRYMWTLGQWTPCSKDCGNGFQRRYVSCIDREKRTSTDPAHCNSTAHPQATRSCNNGNCRVNAPGSYVHWKPSVWGPCSKSCDLGEQNQLVTCEAVFDDGTTAMVDDERCLEEYKSKPQYQRSCNDEVVCPSWSHSAWGKCSVTCGKGQEERIVRCHGDQNSHLSDQSCDPSLKPVSLRLCNKASCQRQPERQIRLCQDEYYGCCPDGVTPAQGPRMIGCPGVTTVKPNVHRQTRSTESVRREKTCRDTYYGCCRDGVTSAEGLFFEGCPSVSTSRPRPIRKEMKYKPEDYLRLCKDEYYGCCPDGVTAADGPNMRGCPPTEPQRETASPTIVLRPKDSTFIVNRPAHLNCKVRGQPEPWVSWYHNDQKIVEQLDNNRMILDDGQLFFIQALPSDNGLYHCNVTNTYGSATSQKVRVKVSNNIVITEDDATTTKAPVLEPTNRCQQEPKRGPCRNYTIAWYYNNQEQTCKQFWYGNCDGNDNRFVSTEDCKAACKKPVVTDTCQLDPEVGRCRARIPMYYYDRSSQSCQQFFYGGCGGNDNRFRTVAECERSCGSKTSALGDDDLLCKRSTYGCCSDGVTSAQGKNNFGCPSACENTRYGCCDDDVTAAQGADQEGCDDIEIGGSGDQPSCELTRYGCCPDKVTAVEDGCPMVEMTTAAPTVDKDLVIDGSLPDQCLLDKETGPCRDNLTVLWYYNREEADCRQFWYGGCQGNQNRFKSQKECQTTCKGKPREVPDRTLPVCQQPKEAGPCNDALTRWYHNADTRQCEEFVYSGCPGNNNNFKARQECESYCNVRGTPVSKPYECPSPSSLGGNSLTPCTATCHYDGDCPGNEKCCGNENACRACTSPYVPRPVTREQVCHLPSETGPCRSYLKRWHFNTDTRQCEKFTYGGCGGNQNNFETEETCQRYCRIEGVVDTNKRPRDPVCQLEPNMGPCRRSEEKWFYNSTTMQCDTFTYGGCVGNHNNFETETKCHTYCGLRTGMSQEGACKLPKEEGDCRGNLQRWYYDAQSGSCFAFVYGGCQGNQNNFDSNEECMSLCRDVRVDYNPRTERPVVTAAPVPGPTNEDICSLPLVTPCDREAGQYWYYNNDDGVCKEVPNGECNNNRNNFLSREQCERFCSRERVCQPLTYTSDFRCMALIPRWSYDQKTGTCMEFSYGGCGGSANNFMSQELCERKCIGRTVPLVTTAEPEAATREEVCTMPEETGPCRAFSTKWHYDKKDGTCKDFTYGGCQGNRNNFETREECERFCDRDTVCRQFIELEVTCLAYIPSWRYNPRSATCENFIYGGCGGNANNFETIEACERKCIPTTTVAVDRGQNDNRYNTWRDICNMQADVGPCKMYTRKWHYNSITQDCEEFSYGGCLGNHNNFESRMQCMTYCGPRDEDRRVATTPEPDEVEGSGDIDKDNSEICNQPMLVGVCKAALPAWFYDHLEGECRQFLYGGCNGNDNRFDTKEACESTCDAYKVCKLPQRNGPCMKYLPRFFFDYLSGECVEFAYGGCDGNANNFERKEACIKRCGPLILDRQPAVEKVGTCPILVGGVKGDADEDMGICLEECRTDSDCDSNKKCCANGCSLVCLSPNGIHPTRPSRDSKVGYCPAKIDRQGLLGACAPTCQYDRDCSGSLKCCHVGCGPACTEPVAEEPYQMSAPVYLRAESRDQSIYLSWQDPVLGQEQKIRDRRYYTVRYFSYSIGRYQYRDVTDLRSVLSELEPETEYEISVRVNNSPYLSEWSQSVAARVPAQTRPADKAGYCPAKMDPLGLLYACAPQCQSDNECRGVEKCCSVGCGPACTSPVAEEPYQMRVPIYLRAVAGDRYADLQWQDQELGPDQHVRDRRYYTVRYHSLDATEQGLQYMNVSSLKTRLTGLQPGAEYMVIVRVNKPPYLSEWTEDVTVRVPAVATASPNTARHSQCMVPKGQGDCEARHVMWYYHAKIQDCRRFIYTGCNGNDNKFESRDECRRVCRGYSEERFVYTKRPSSRRPRPVPTRDSHGTTPRPVPTRDSHGISQCAQEKDPGTCSTWEIKWFYDTSINRCNRFWYGSCGGNDNRFNDEVECKAACLSGRERTTEPPRVHDCSRTSYGCCRDGFTMAQDRQKTNCPENAKTDARTVLVQPGENAVLTCRIYAGATPAWYREGKLLKTEGNVEVFDNGTLLIRAATIEHDGNYACNSGQDSQSFDRYKLVVQVPIGIVPGPDNIISKPGHMAFMHCETYGNPPATVSWMKGNNPVSPDSRYEVFSNGTLLIRHTAESDIDVYRCKAENGISNPEYRTVNFSLREMLDARIENDNGRVTEGDRIYLHCQGKGYPSPTITWEKSGRPLVSSGNINLQEDGRVYIRNAALSDTGSYTCIVANSEEKIETSTSVQVVPKDIESDTCVDVSSMMKCRLIVTAKLCSYSMYSKICCKSCHRG